MTTATKTTRAPRQASKATAVEAVATSGDIYPTSATLSARDILMRTGLLVDGKIVMKNMPEPAYQRGNQPFTLRQKNDYLAHLLSGGTFDSISVWSSKDDTIEEVLDGRQRLHCLALAVEALLARELDEECEINSNVDKAISAVLESGRKLATLATVLDTVPWFVVKYPKALGYQERVKLFLLLNDGISVAVKHKADVATAEAIEMLTKAGISMVTAKAGKAAKVKDDKPGAKHAFASASVLEGLAAYINMHTDDTIAKLTDHDANLKMLKKIEGAEEEVFADLNTILYQVMPLLHDRYDDTTGGLGWNQVKIESVTVIVGLAAGLGYARASQPNAKVVDANVKALLALLGSGVDPLGINTAGVGLKRYYDAPTNNGKKRRKLVAEGFKAFFERGAAEGAHPIRWDLAAANASITA